MALAEQTVGEEVCKSDKKSEIGISIGVFNFCCSS